MAKTILSIPLELRRHIYSHLLESAELLGTQSKRLKSLGFSYYSHHPPAIALLLVCKQVCAEILDHYFDNCTFTQYIANVKTGAVSPGSMPSKPGQAKLLASPLLQVVRHYELAFVIPLKPSEEVEGFGVTMDADHSGAEEYCWLMMTSFHAVVSRFPAFRSLHVTFVNGFADIFRTTSLPGDIHGIGESSIPLEKTSGIFGLRHKDSAKESRLVWRLKQPKLQERRKRSYDAMTDKKYTLGVRSSLSITQPNMPLTLYRREFTRTLHLIGLRPPTNSEPTPRSRFMELPLELRSHVYTHLLQPEMYPYDPDLRFSKQMRKAGIVAKSHTPPSAALLTVNRQIHAEILERYCQLCTFTFYVSLSNKQDFRTAKTADHLLNSSIFPYLRRIKILFFFNALHLSIHTKVDRGRCLISQTQQLCNVLTRARHLREISLEWHDFTTAGVLIEPDQIYGIMDPIKSLVRESELKIVGDIRGTPHAVVSSIKSQMQIL